MVAIAYGKGVVLCEQWEGTITGEKFASIVKRCLRKAFRNSASPKGKLFLMDGCPRQNSRVAMRAIEKVGAKVFKIPAQSPDLNPMENFCNTITMKLNNDAVEKQITRESINEFSLRIKKTMQSFSSDQIDKIIESMDKQITAVQHVEMYILIYTISLVTYVVTCTVTCGNMLCDSSKLIKNCIKKINSKN